MIQFNLLPDVKINYIKARRTKRTVILSAVGTIAVSLAALLLLSMVVFVWQSIKLNNLDKSIKNLSSEIQNKPDINKVLTIQNQLTSIDALHMDKPETSRLFTYLTQITPSVITIESYTLDLSVESPTMSFTGQATSLEDVNKFVDTLKFTTISRSENDKEETRAFSQVVLESFGIDTSGSSFTIQLTYDPAIFSSQETELTLVIPKITTTRSSTERPGALFQENETPLEGTSP